MIDIHLINKAGKTNASGLDLTQFYILIDNEKRLLKDCWNEDGCTRIQTFFEDHKYVPISYLICIKLSL